MGETFSAVMDRTRGSRRHGWLGTLGRLVGLGYDATEDKGRRKSPVPLLRSEDDELPIYRRNQIQSTARDIRRNFAIAAWAIRCHLNYLTRFRFRPMTGDKALDARVAELIQWSGKAANFDAAGRHSLRRYTRLIEAGRTVDGDHLTVLLGNARVQGIEGDRIRTPMSYGRDVPPLSTDTLKRTKAGVVTDDFGKPIAFCVNKRGPQYRVGPDLINPANAFTFERLVSARNCIHLGYFDRLDQTRGVSPLAAALNTFRDTYEGFDYALAQAKVSQLFALMIKRNSVKAMEEFGQADGPSEYEKQIDFNRGPVMLDLDPADSAEFLQSNNPGANWQAFMSMVIMASLRSLDIPYSLYDEAHANLSAHRGAWLQYDQACDEKREDLREFLDRWTAWRLGILIYQGVLQLPPGIEPQQLRWHWVARKVPWTDHLKETLASQRDVETGIASTPGVAESMGLDAYEIADQQADYLAYRAMLHLPPLGPSAPIPPEMQSGDEPAAEAATQAA
jgi:capsid protein